MLAAEEAAVAVAVAVVVVVVVVDTRLPGAARGLAPTRAPHVHPAAPCHYISEDASLPPGDSVMGVMTGPGEM